MLRLWLSICASSCPRTTPLSPPPRGGGATLPRVTQQGPGWPGPHPSCPPALCSHSQIPKGKAPHLAQRKEVGMEASLLFIFVPKMFLSLRCPFLLVCRDSPLLEDKLQNGNPSLKCVLFPCTNRSPRAAQVSEPAAQCEDRMPSVCPGPSSESQEGVTYLSPH